MRTTDELKGWIDFVSGIYHPAEGEVPPTREELIALWDEEVNSVYVPPPEKAKDGEK